MTFHPRKYCKMYSAPCQMRGTCYPKCHATPHSNVAQLRIADETTSGKPNFSTQCTPTNVRQPQSVQSVPPGGPHYSKNTTVPQQTTACPQVPTEGRNTFLFNRMQGDGGNTLAQHGNPYPPGQLNITQGLCQDAPLNLSSQTIFIQPPCYIQFLQNFVSTYQFKIPCAETAKKSKGKRNGFCKEVQSPKPLPEQATSGTSSPQLQTSCTGTALSSAEHNVQVAHNQNHSPRIKKRGESSYPGQGISSSVRNATLNELGAQCSSLPQLIPQTQNTSTNPFAQQAGQNLPKPIQNAPSAQGTSLQAFYVVHVSQYHQLSNGQLSLPNPNEQPQKPVSTVSLTNCHSHSSPHKVVAVVQPLTQETRTDASQEGCATITDQCERLAAENNSPEKLCNSTDTDTNLKDDGGANEDLLRTHLHGNATEPAQTVTPAPRQTGNAEVQIKQRREMEEQEGLLVHVELSSVLTIPWTYTKLTTCIDEASKSQESDDSSNTNVIRELLRLYWDNNPENFIKLVKIDFYSTLMTEVKKYCHEHVHCDSVILSQVNPEHQDKLEKSCHVLTQDYVHSEVPYVSSWMNVNDQLDEIDKEFGFSTSYKSDGLKCLTTSDNQGHVAEKDSCISENKLSDMQTEVPLESVVSRDDVKKLNSDCTETALTPILSNTMTDPRDPLYSLKLQVLPQHVAKMVYEQMQSNTVDGEKVINVSIKGELPEAVEVESSEVKLGNKFEKCPIDEFCCINRWMGAALGSTNISLCKCQPLPQQHSRDLSVPSFEADEGAQTESPGVLMLNVVGVPTVAGKYDAPNKPDEEPLMSTWTQLWNLCETIDLTEDEGPHLFTSKDVKNIVVPKSECCSSPVTEEETVNVLSSSENNISVLMSEPKEDCGHARWKASGPARGQDNIGASDNPVDTNNTSADKKTNVSPSSGQRNRHTLGVKPLILHSKNKEIPKKNQKRFDVPEKNCLFLRKREKCKALDRNSQPANSSILKSMNGCPDTSVKTVKLASSSSSTQKKQEDTVAQTPPPPAVPSLTVSPLPRIPPETVPVPKWPIKRRLHEEWRNSYPPKRMKCKNKPFTEKDCTLPFLPDDAHNKRRCKTERTRDLPISSEKPKRSLSSSRQRPSRLDVKRRRLEKPKKNLSPPKNIADRNGIKDKIRKDAFTPIKEDNVLRFSVLPNTFHFKDVSTGTNEARDSALAMPDTRTLVDGNENGSKEILKTPKGVWSQNPEKYFPLCSVPLIPKTAVMFEEFKKKYREKQQSTKANHAKKFCQP